jgi:hypothetical protein
LADNHERPAASLADLSASNGNGASRPYARPEFSFYRPSCETLQDFLSKCGELDGSEAGPLAPLLPLVDASAPPTMDVALRSLNGYFEAKKASAKLGRFTCLPWAGMPAYSGGKPRIGIMLPAIYAFDRPGQNESLADKLKYAARHGYDIHVMKEASVGRHGAWAKLPLALSLLAGYDWLFHIDLDTVILDHAVRLEEVRGCEGCFVRCCRSVMAEEKGVD